MKLGIHIGDGSPREFLGDSAVYMQRLLATIARVYPDSGVVALGEAATRFPQYAVAGAPAAGGLRSLFGGGIEQAAKTHEVEVILSSIAEPALPSARIAEVLYCIDATATIEEAARSGGAARLKQMRKGIARANCIFTASEYSRRVLLEKMEVPLDRVIVVPPGTDESFDKAHEGFVDPPYYLVVGNLTTDSGFDMLVEALESLGASMVMVGQAMPDEPAEYSQRVLRVESCSGPHLAGLYQHAELVVCLASTASQPLRVLEAMRAGAQIVAPQAGAIPEYAGQAPIYFNAKSTESLVRALKRVGEETPDAREKRLRLPRQKAREFTWDKAAWKLLNALDRR